MNKNLKILLVLALAMVVGLMPGMGLTAQADTATIYPFDSTADNWSPSGNFEYSFTTNSPNLTQEQLGKITKIEVLIDMESIADTGWGQVVYAKGTDANDRHFAKFDNTPCIKKYTAGGGSVDGADSAVVQLVGKGRLLAYTITFNEGDPKTEGDWTIPDITPPVAKTGLEVTGSQQELVTPGTITGTGTGTFEYSLDNTTWSTDVPKGKDAANYTVYYRLKYGENNDKTYTPLQGEQGIPVSITKKKVTVTAKNQSIYVGETVPTLVGADFYTVTGLLGTDTLTTDPTLAYQQNNAAANPDNTSAGTYDIVASGATASDNYTITYVNGTLTISKKPQTISAQNVSVTYGDTGKKVTATTDGDGAISYAVKDGSTEYIDVDASTGELTIKKVGTATVVVTEAETKTCAQATKEVNVTISAPYVPPTPSVTYYSVRFVNDGTTVASYSLSYGSRVPLPEEPAAPEGKQFDGWFKDGADAAYDFSRGATESVTVYARFSDLPVVEPEPTEEPAELQGIKLSKNGKKAIKKATVKKGKKLKLKVITDPAGFDTSFTFKSSKPKVASVSKKGVVKGKKKGKTTITVTAANGMTAKIKVTVK